MHFLQMHLLGQKKKKKQKTKNHKDTFVVAREQGYAPLFGKTYNAKGVI
jgi:hypothetical protein